MLLFNNFQICVKGLLLGYQYDNLTRTLDVQGDIPSGWDWVAMVQIGSNFDIIPLTATETGLSATLTADNLSITGYYTVQLKATQGELVQHTNVVQTFVGASLSGDAKWPTIPTEFTQLEQRVQASAAEAQASAEAAAQSAQDAETAAQDAADQTAQQLRSKFEALAKEASDSAQSAEASAQSASAAAGSADQSASAAWVSANQAAASAQSAAAASSAAAQSASGATDAAGTAQSAATQAQQSAESASKQAQTAGDHAADADQSAKSAADAQVSAETAAGNAEQSANAAAQSAQEADAAAENAKTIIDDTTAQLGKTWSSLTIVDRLAPAFESSGPVVTCNPVKGYPLNVVSQIVAVQGGTGDPSPDNVRPIFGYSSATVTRCEKNMVGADSDVYSYGTPYLGINLTGISQDLVLSIQLKDGKDIPSGVSFGFIYSYINSSGNRATRADWSITPTKPGEYIAALKINRSNFDYLCMLACYPGNIETWQKVFDAFDVQLEPGDTPTSYEPYIGQTITLPFGRTVYGGELDWSTGVLTVTHAEIASYAGETLPGSWISDRDVYSQGATPTTGAQVVYELSVPRTIQLTTTEILALSGVNTIYTDTGDTTVSGRADPNTIIQQLAARIAALEGAATNL